MGFIASLSKSAPPSDNKYHPSPFTRETGEDLFSRSSGRAVWDRVFGPSKPQENQGPTFPPVRGGTYGRSAITDPESFKRLLEAMRSRAPGNWSDNRWEQTKHFEGIQYVAIHRGSEQMAQAEFRIFEKDPRHPDGKREVHEGHPGYQLVELLNKPNNDDSFGDLMYRWNQQMDLTGTALTWMVPNRLGFPYELYSVPTAIAIPQPAVNPDYPDGYYRIQPLYPYGPFSSYPTPSTAVGAPIPGQWMLRFCYPHPLFRYEGYAPTTGGRRQIDQLDAIEKSRWWSMKRGINPSAVLNFEAVEGMETLPWEEIERIRTEFENNQQGPDNIGRLFIATNGARLEPFGPRPVDMDYPSGWEQLASMVLGGVFGITRQAAGMIEDSSYSTLFATLKQLYWTTLEPKCKRISDKLTRHLAPFFAPNLLVEISCKPINDHEIRFQKIEKLMAAKAMTKNELRRMLDEPMTAEPWGNEIVGTDTQSPLAEMVLGAPIPATNSTNQAGLPLALDRNGQDMPLEGGPGDNQLNSQVEGDRPFPGDMGDGSAGPRKSLLDALEEERRKKVGRKSFYDQVMEVVGNGHK